MKEKITKMKQGEGLSHDKTDWGRLDAMRDEDIDYSDIPAIPEDFDWSRATLVKPQHKKQLTLRLDAEMVAWFKRQGRGYQTRMNAVLKSFYEAHRHD